MTCVSSELGQTYQRVVFSDVIDIVRCRGRIVEPLESSVRHVFLILCPRNPRFLENVDDRCDLLRNGMQVVVTDTEIISPDYRDVIGFTRMCKSVIIGKKDPLRCKKSEIGLRKRLVIILKLVAAFKVDVYRILKPDLVKVVERSALNIGRMTRR